MEKIHIGLIGMIAGICTTVSLVPQILKILKTKHARDVSLGMYIILSTGVLLWLIYGIFLEELPLILANAVTLALCFTVIVMKLMFRGGSDR
ncbi:MAG: SemiSWEET transporter [Candidatus Tantalella remota]|nr:SemiSWEET transporter [Candidatus Tantalella remota]